MKVTEILAVGIDPAKKTHHAVAIVYPEIKLMSKRINNNYNSIIEFDKAIEELARKKDLKIIYGLEDSGSYGKGLKEFLLEKERTILEINPMKTNRQKDFYGQDKSDPIDATCVASIVLRSHEELPELKKSTSVYESIRQAERFREILVKSKTQNVNRLHFYLTHAWMGSYKELFRSLLSNQALELFSRFPVPEMLKQTDSRKLARLLYLASKGRGGNPKKAVKPKPYALQKAKLILEAVASVKERQITPEKEMQAEIIRQLALNLKQFKLGIKAIDKKLAKLISQTGQKIESFKGINTVTASVILGELLNPDRINTTSEFALYNGTAPRLDSTGGRIKHVANKRCNRRLKRTLHQIALTASVHDPISKSFYQASIRRGLSKEEALKRLARRISDIIFVMLKTKSAYDKDKALLNMMRRRSPYCLLKQNEGKMAISKQEAPQTVAFIENIEPCLTLASEYITGEGKRKGKNDHLGLFIRNKLSSHNVDLKNCSIVPQAQRSPLRHT